jgi:hypothetical protein
MNGIDVISYTSDVWYRYLESALSAVADLEGEPDEWYGYYNIDILV